MNVSIVVIPKTWDEILIGELKEKGSLRGLNLGSPDVPSKLRLRDAQRCCSKVKVMDQAQGGDASGAHFASHSAAFPESSVPSVPYRVVSHPVEWKAL